MAGAGVPYLGAAVSTTSSSSTSTASSSTTSSSTSTAPTTSSSTAGACLLALFVGKLAAYEPGLVSAVCCHVDWLLCAGVVARHVVPAALLHSTSTVAGGPGALATCARRLAAEHGTHASAVACLKIMWRCKAQATKHVWHLVLADNVLHINQNDATEEDVYALGRLVKILGVTVHWNWYKSTTDARSCSEQWELGEQRCEMWFRHLCYQGGLLPCCRCHRWFDYDEHAQELDQESYFDTFFNRYVDYFDGCVCYTCLIHTLVHYQRPTETGTDPLPFHTDFVERFRHSHANPPTATATGAVNTTAPSTPEDVDLCPGERALLAFDPGACEGCRYFVEVELEYTEEKNRLARATAALHDHANPAAFVGVGRHC